MWIREKGVIIPQTSPIECLSVVPKLFLPAVRGVYLGKSGCLVLPKNLSFYEKPPKNVMCLD